MMAFAVVKLLQEAGTNGRNQRADVCWSGVTSGTKRNAPHLEFAQPGHRQGPDRFLLTSAPLRFCAPPPHFNPAL